MYYNNFYSNELLSNPDEVVKKLVHCVKEWNVDHTVVEGLGIQEFDKIVHAFRMTYVPFGWKERLNEKEIVKHNTIWSFWDTDPLVSKTIFKNVKESLDEECVKKHIQEMIYELQKTMKEQNITKKKAEIILASEQFEI